MLDDVLEVIRKGHDVPEGSRMTGGSCEEDISTNSPGKDDPSAAKTEATGGRTGLPPPPPSPPNNNNHHSDNLMTRVGGRRYPSP